MTQHAMVGTAQRNAVSPTASTAFYVPFGSELSTAQTTEANVQTTLRIGCSMANLYVNLPTNTRTATAFGVSVNGSPSALTVSSTATTTGLYSDLSHVIAVASTDKAEFVITAGSGGGSIQVSGLTCDLQSTGQAATQFGGNVATSLSTSARFLSFSGTFTAQTSDTNIQMVALEAATMSNMQVVFTVNASAGFTVTSRKNAGAGSQSISVGASATGLFEDNTNTDSLSALDTFDFSVGANTSAPTISAATCKWTTGTASHCQANNSRPSSPLASGATDYAALYASPLLTTTQSSCFTPMPYAATLSLLSAKITANSSAAGATFNQYGGAAGTTALNGTVALGTGTGTVQDVTHTDSLAAADLANMRGTGASANIQLGWAGVVIVGPNTSPPSGNNSLLTLGVGN